MVPAADSCSDDSDDHKAEEAETILSAPEITELTIGLPVRMEAVGSAGRPEVGTTPWLVRQLGNRWTFPVLNALGRSPLRFAKLKRALEPVSQRMLTLSLRKLERDGLVHREEVPGQPPQVTYELTPLGISLLAPLTVLDHWLETNREKIFTANVRFRRRGGVRF